MNGLLSEQADWQTQDSRLWFLRRTALQSTSDSKFDYNLPSYDACMTSTCTEIKCVPLCAHYPSAPNIGYKSLMQLQLSIQGDDTGTFEKLVVAFDLAPESRAFYTNPKGLFWTQCLGGHGCESYDWRQCCDTIFEYAQQMNAVGCLAVLNIHSTPVPCFLDVRSIGDPGNVHFRCEPSSHGSCMIHSTSYLCQPNTLSTSCKLHHMRLSLNSKLQLF